MIKFFRRIRQNLLSEGRTGTYLQYAIGEILLVVIGILIALSINNWNQQRLDKRRAIEYHHRLMDDLDFIIEGNQDIHKLALKVMSSITRTVEILEKGAIEHEAEQEVIDYTMVMFTRLSRQVSNISTWEEMKNNGDINLIYNIELRKKVDALQGFIDLAHEVFSKHAAAIRNDMSIYSKYMRTNVDSETLQETVIPNFEAMAADPQFINQFSSNTASWRSQASFTKNIANRAVSLKDRIAIELEAM